MLNNDEQKAIREKVGQLNKVKKGILSPQALAIMIKKRRTGWLNKNKDKFFKKYNHLDDVEKAYYIIFFEHMKINPEHSKMLRHNENRIRINSYNFCPYLEACQELKLDTKFVCKTIGEPSIQSLCKIINPKLKFRRNYNNIRPYNSKYCEEYIEF